MKQKRLEVEFYHAVILLFFVVLVLVHSGMAIERGDIGWWGRLMLADGTVVLVLTFLAWLVDTVVFGFRARRAKHE